MTNEQVIKKMKEDMRTDLYSSDDNSKNRSNAVRPIVSLESNIQLEGNSEDGWTII